MTAAAVDRPTTIVLAALTQRLREAGRVLLDEVPTHDADLTRDCGQLLAALGSRARANSDTSVTWLLLTALTGAYPTAEDVARIRRAMELARDDTDVVFILMNHATSTIVERELPPVSIEIVEEHVVIDVDFSAKNDKETGIQRVTRRVCSLWEVEHDPVLVAWSSGHVAHRRLSDRESQRVLCGGDQRRVRSAQVPTRRSIPWRCTVVLTEVPPEAALPTLAALAEFSGNRIAAIGYDAIPITSSELRPLGDADTFTKYLTVLKHTHLIAGISASSASEFRGFSDALATQGLTGPKVVEVMLATEIAAATGVVPIAPRPVVLCIGSHELHKNHLAVLHAAETLWREGLDFELHFIGGVGWDMSEFRSRTDALRAAGRPLVDHGRLSDDEMWRICRGAAFTVFPSLHEGFGLPVSESLACGTPVITTEYGSTREIAAGGGCVLIDPRDDSAFADQMRRLLSNPGDLEELRDEARHYQPKSWASYASELWNAIGSTDVGTADEK